MRDNFHADISFLHCLFSDTFAIPEIPDTMVVLNLGEVLHSDRSAKYAVIKSCL